MSPTYKKAADGYKFSLTALGANFTYVRVKFLKTCKTYKRYQHCVPVNWVEKGYVVEVKEDAQES